MTKRERFLKVLANEPVDRVPVAFFHHFTGPSDWNMGLENPEAFERNIEGHRPALEKFDPDIIKIMNDTLMMMPMDVSFVETAEDLKKIQPMSMDCEYVKKQIELTKRVVEIYKGHDAPLLVTSFSAAWLLRNAFTVDLPVAGAEEHILSICKEYMPGVMTAIYWLVVMLSVISTGPTFIFNTSNRFVKVWKTEKVPQRVKLFVIALAFLLLCLALSKIGLIAICQKGYTALGNVAIFAIAAPLFVSIIRVRKKDKADAEAAAAQKSEQ